MSKFGEIAFWVVDVCIQFAIAVLISMIVGFIPEVLVSRFYRNTLVNPFTPVMAIVAVLLGAASAKKLRDPASLWIWIPSVLWFGSGLFSTARQWSPEWDHSSSSALAYAVKQLLTSNCGSSECIGELMFTTPLVCAISYSIGALIGFRRSREIAETPLHRWLSLTKSLRHPTLQG